MILHCITIHSIALNHWLVPGTRQCSNAAFHYNTQILHSITRHLIAFTDKTLRQDNALMQYQRLVPVLHLWYNKIHFCDTNSLVWNSKTTTHKFNILDLQGTTMHLNAANALMHCNIKTFICTAQLIKCTYSSKRNSCSPIIMHSDRFPIMCFGAVGSVLHLRGHLLDLNLVLLCFLFDLYL